MTLSEILWLVVILVCVVVPLGGLLSMAFQISTSVVTPANQPTGERPASIVLGVILGVGIMAILLLTVRVHFINQGAWQAFGWASLICAGVYIAFVLASAIYGSSQSRPGDPTEKRGNLSTVLNISAAMLPGALLLFTGGSIATALVGGGWGVENGGKMLPFYGMMLLPVVIGIPTLIGGLLISVFSKYASNHLVPVGVVSGISGGILLPFVMTQLNA